MMEKNMKAILKMINKDGYGVFRWTNGIVYEGQWKNNKQHGVGMITTASGKFRKGKWEKGRRLRWVF